MVINLPYKDMKLTAYDLNRAQIKADCQAIWGACVSAPD